MDGKEGSRRSSPNKWTKEEDIRLLEAVQALGTKSWKNISALVQTKDHNSCYQHWRRVLNPKISKTKFSKEELFKLAVAVARHGTHRWAKVSKELSTRTDTQCRARWKEIESSRTRAARELIDVMKRHRKGMEHDSDSTQGGSHKRGSEDLWDPIQTNTHRRFHGEHVGSKQKHDVSFQEDSENARLQFGTLYPSTSDVQTQWKGWFQPTIDVGVFKEDSPSTPMHLFAHSLPPLRLPAWGSHVSSPFPDIHSAPLSTAGVETTGPLKLLTLAANPAVPSPHLRRGTYVSESTNSTALDMWYLKKTD